MYNYYGIVDTFFHKMCLFVLQTVQGSSVGVCEGNERWIVHTKLPFLVSDGKNDYEYQTDKAKLGKQFECSTCSDLSSTP